MASNTAASPPQAGCQKYKIHSDSSGRSDEPDSPHWLVVTRQNNPDFNFENHRLTLRPRRDVACPSVSSAQAVSSLNSTGGLNSMDGLATDMTKSISAASIEHSDAESIHSRLFNNVLNDLDAYGASKTEQQQYQSYREMSLSHVGEALISLNLSDETMACLRGMGVYYPASEPGQDAIGRDAAGFTLWDTISDFLVNFIHVPTQRTFHAVQNHFENIYDEQGWALGNHKFQVAFFLACISIAVAAKVFDRRRMRLPISVVNKCLEEVIDNRYSVIDQAILERVFDAVTKK